MIAKSSGQLLEEIRAAETLRDSHIAHLRAMVQKMVGPYFRGRKGEGWDYTPENNYFEYLSIVLPRLVHDNPRVRVTTRRGGAPEQVGKAMELGINRWVGDIDLQEPLGRVMTDMLFGWGVLLLGLTENVRLSGMRLPEWAAHPRWPHVQRISPYLWYVDPGADSLDTARYMGHAVHEDKEDLLARAKLNPEQGWYLEAVEDLRPTTDPQELGRRRDREIPYRGEVRYYETWIPESELDDSDREFWEEDENFEPERAGFHGIIRTIAVAGDLAQQLESGPYTPTRLDPLGYESMSFDQETAVRELRRPRRFYGPRTGPYVPFGVYEVPDEVYPLSPLIAVEGNVEELNRTSVAISKGIERYKQFVAADSEIAEGIVESPHQHVVSIPGFDRSKAEAFEVGGVTEQQLVARNYLRDVLERVQGIADVSRGQTQGNRTATSDALADSATQVRFSHVQRAGLRATVRLLNGASWYLYYEDDIIFPLGPEAANTLNLELEAGEEVWFMGGNADPESGFTHDDLAMEIQPYTMERTDERLLQHRLMQGAQLVLQVAPLIPQAPYIRWKSWFEKVGTALNMPDFHELIDVDAAMAFIGQGPQPGGPQAQGQLATGQPRFSGGRLRPTSPAQAGGAGASPFPPLLGNATGGSLAPAAQGVPAA